MTLLLSLRLELRKILRQRGTYAGPAILLVIVALFVWGLWRYGPERSLARQFDSSMLIGGKLVTGLTTARNVMEPCLLVLLPLLVAAVAGGLVAGEARSGLLRSWLCRPVHRWTVLTAKFLAGWLHATGLTLFLGLIALGLGYAFFGGGDLVDFRSGDGLVVLTQSQALVRLALAYGLAALLMAALASLALLASTLFENPLVAAAVAVAFLPAATILGALPYFEFLKPYLLTTHLDVWRFAFRGTLDAADFTAAVTCVLGYCLIPYVAGCLIFQGRDLTC